MIDDDIQIVPVKLSKTNSADSTAMASKITSKRLTKKSKEISQNETNNDFEKNAATIRSSTPILSQSSVATAAKTKQTVQNVTRLSPRNGDLSDHAAYKEYKEAGEYWK